MQYTTLFYHIQELSLYIYRSSL